VTDGSAKYGPVVICRCEEITEAEIVAAFEAGYRSPDELKRKLRCGMGPCQGRTCGPLILSLLSQLTGRPVEEIAPLTTRPPLRATPLGMFARLAVDAGEGEGAARAGRGQDAQGRVGGGGERPGQDSAGPRGGGEDR
jgi:bacterioferritin-associated ferredoxin